MGINFDKVLGVNVTAIQLRNIRSELIAANLAHVNTPNFQAQDIDFVNEMQRAKYKWAKGEIQKKYRIPYQPSMDGNTVTLHVEQTEFAKNELHYQTSLSFLKMKLAGIKKAIEGK